MLFLPYNLTLKYLLEWIKKQTIRKKYLTFLYNSNIFLVKFMPESTPQAPPPQVAYNPALTQQVQGPPQVGAPATAAPAQAAG